MTNQEARIIIGKITLDRVSEEESIALGHAIKALEKQIPKVPINGIDYPLCPNCESPFYLIGGEYCVNCGQAIEWEYEGAEINDKRRTKNGIINL